MKDTLLTYGKALTAAVGSAVVGVGIAMGDGDLTKPEVLVAIGGGLVVGFGAVFAPYRPTGAE